jgi:hypothetical protein
MGRKQGARKKNNGVAALGMLPCLRNPDAVVGETLGVPGTWFNFSGVGAAANKLKTHLGTVQSFSAMHRFTGSCIGAAMELSFVGDDQTTWMRYPMPFLTYWYKSHPQQSDAAPASIVLSDESGEDDWELEEDASPKKDKAAVYAFLSPVIRDVRDGHQFKFYVVQDGILASLSKNTLNHIECVYLKYFEYSRISPFGFIRNTNTEICGYLEYEYVFMRHPGERGHFKVLWSLEHK